MGSDLNHLEVSDDDIIQMFNNHLTKIIWWNRARAPTMTLSAISRQSVTATGDQSSEYNTSGADDTKQGRRPAIARIWLDAIRDRRPVKINDEMSPTGEGRIYCDCSEARRSFSSKGDHLVRLEEWRLWKMTLPITGRPAALVMTNPTSLWQSATFAKHLYIDSFQKNI